MDTHRIKVKLGNAEFDAEGQADKVQAQYDAFLRLVEAQSAAPPPPPPAPIHDNTPVKPDPPGALPRSVLERIFRQGEVLSLAALPSGEDMEADAMLALLYGYRTIGGEQTVTGTMLRKSALLSGVNIQRADRVLNTLIPDYVLAAGVKKAKRYQLNNRGEAKAEAIIKAVLQ